MATATDPGLGLLLAQLLEKHGLGPQSNPGFFDQAQRDMDALWASGLSMHAIVGKFVEKKRAAATPQARLRRAWRSGYPDLYSELSA